MLNTTRFPAQCFRQFTPSGELLGVAVVAACFAIRRDGGLRQLLKQPPLVMSDIYEGEPLASPLLVQGDLVPYKPATDITFLGETFAPGGRPLPEWNCALDVGTISKKLRISGPRDWVRQYGSRLSWRRQDGDRWRLSDPVHVPKVALDWRKAFGGTISDDSESPADVVSDNPLGCGLLSNAIPAGIARVPAPQIDTPDQSARVAFARPKPQGLAPIPPFWRPRQRHAGTYDGPWLRHRHPLLPRDFDMRFWNAAALTANPWLRGDEAFRLLNLNAGQPELSGRLPALRPVLSVPLRGGARQRLRAPMILDGVQFDLRPQMARDGAVGVLRLTWRISFPWPDRSVRPELTLGALQEAA